jgi:hypothetical protein
LPRHGNWPLLAASLLLSAALLVLGGASSDSVPQVRYPQPDIGVDTLAARKQAQADTVDQFKVFYRFHLTDKVKHSGITFIHHIVDDAGIDYKLVHYDHGNGIAVADVDGDGLYDIYFVNQVGGNELWKNLGGGKFKNITKEAGVGLPGRISVAASFADIDNDGTQDLFVTTVLGGNALFKNDGHGHFTNITKAAGLAPLCACRRPDRPVPNTMTGNLVTSLRACYRFTSVWVTPQKSTASKWTGPPAKSRS